MGKMNGTLFLLLALFPLHGPASDPSRQSASQPEIAASVKEVSGPVYWKRDRRARAVRLDPRSDTGRSLHAGELVRCMKGGVLWLAWGGARIPISPKDNWYEIKTPPVPVKRESDEETDTGTGGRKGLAKGDSKRSESTATAGVRDVVAFARPLESGEYTGVFRSDVLGELPISMEIKNERGNLSGKVETSKGEGRVSGTVDPDGKVRLILEVGENQGRIAGRAAEDRIVGDWTLAGATGRVELKKGERLAEKLSEPARGDVRTSAKDPITGEWEGLAEVQGMTVPFTLKLVVDGERVTGESSSAQGTSTISKGIWSGERLSFTLDTPNGTISFNANLKQGKLVGDFEFAGQMQGKWTATKRN